MRRCRENGWLVGGRNWLPAEPFDYNWGRQHPLIGCNRLRCSRCDEEVRHWLVLDGNARRYECRCQSRDESKGLPLDGSDRSFLNSFSTGWACAGHPDLELPVVLDGVALDRQADFAAITAAALLAPPLRPTLFVGGPAFWVTRLYWLLPSGELRRRLGLAVAEHLLAPDARVQLGALDFFRDVRDAPGAERLAVVAQRHRARFDVTIPEDPSRTMAEPLFRALMNRLNAVDVAGQPVDQAALAVLRAEVLRGSGPSGVLHQLALSDRDWLCEHAAAVVKSAPARLDELVFVVRKAPRDKLVAVIAAIARLDEVTPATLREAVERRLPEPARTEVLAALSALA